MKIKLSLGNIVDCFWEVVFLSYGSYREGLCKLVLWVECLARHCLLMLCRQELPSQKKVLFFEFW